MAESKIRVPVFAEERKTQILEILQKKQKIIVPELCNIFGVSASTIRNDLRALEESNLLMRTHGGAIIKSKVQLEATPDRKKTLMVKQKKAIGKAAADLVEDGDTIIISTGTTTFEFARCLLSKKNLTVVLNDLRTAILLETSTDFSIYIIGGIVRPGFHYSLALESELPKISVDKAFFSCNGLSLEHGATIPDLMLASNVKSLLKLSSESILLCDSSKIGSVSFAQILPLENLSKLIIDSDANLDDIDSLRKIESCELIIAPLENE